MPEAMEIREQDVELRVGCGHDRHFGLQRSKYGGRDLIQHLRIKMFNPVAAVNITHHTHTVEVTHYSHFYTGQEVKVHQPLVWRGY